MHTASLIFENEIRFGPAYYKLLIDKHLLEGRVFGGELKWHDSASIFAAEEWLTVDYNEGPITRAVLFDLAEVRLSSFSTVTKGFVGDFRFESDTFLYQKKYASSGIIQEMEVNISQISSWEHLTF